MSMSTIVNTLDFQLNVHFFHVNLGTYCLTNLYPALRTGTSTFQVYLILFSLGGAVNLILMLALHEYCL